MSNAKVGTVLEFLTPAEAGRLVGNLTGAGVVAAAERGRITIAARTPSGHRLFTRAAVIKFRDEREARRQARAALPGAVFASRD